MPEHRKEVFQLGMPVYFGSRYVLLDDKEFLVLRRQQASRISEAGSAEPAAMY